MAQILKEEVRNRILQAAEAQLLANGEAATMRQIAQAAGITPGNLYRYYNNKDELVDAIIQPLVERMDQVLRTTTGESFHLGQDELPPLPAGCSLENLIGEWFYPLLMNVLVQTAEMCRLHPRQAEILMNMESAGANLISWFRKIMDQALLRLLVPASEEKRREIELIADAECEAFCTGIANILKNCSKLSPKGAESLLESFVYIHLQGINTLLCRELAAGSARLREENLHGRSETGR